jgi:rhodanese-related sulfurtransferase
MDWTAIRKTLQQALMVALLGLGFALLANHLSPRGISLTRNYFFFNNEVAHARTNAPAPSQSTSRTNAAGVETAADRGARLRARLAEKGLQLITHVQAVEFFNDARFAQGLIVFVDARNDKHYEAGHIPGAHQLDHYRLERYLQDLLPRCLIAESVVIYCNGGECEDSLFAATDLLEVGLPAAKLLIYEGGFNEWKQAGMPVETGRGDRIDAANP